MAASGLPVVERNKADLRSGRSRFKSEIVFGIARIYEHGICNQRMSIFSQSLPVSKIVLIGYARIALIVGNERRFCPFWAPVQVVVYKEPAGAVIEAQPFAIVVLHFALVKINDVVGKSEGRPVRTASPQQLLPEKGEDIVGDH